MYSPTPADASAPHQPPGWRDFASAVRGSAVRFIFQVVKPNSIDRNRTLPRTFLLCR